MNKKNIVIIFLILLLCGCDKLIKVNNPLTEDEVIKYVKDKIYAETGDVVSVTIINKDTLKVCASWFDSCIRYQNVSGGYSYKLEIKSEDNNITGYGIYNDAYTVYSDVEKEQSASFEDNYIEQKNLYLIKNEFISILNDNFDKYYIYNDVSNETGYDIFINSNDYNKINDALLNLNRTVNKYREYVYTSFSVYIYKDSNVFSNTNFELYKNGKEDYSGQSYGKDMIEQYTNSEVTRIDSCEGFEYDLFIDDLNKDIFDYSVFWYTSEPNAIYHNGSTQVFGVK